MAQLFVSIDERLPSNPNLWVLITDGIGMYSMGRWDGKKWEIKKFSELGLPQNEYSSRTMTSGQITHWADFLTFKISYTS